MNQEEIFSKFKKISDPKRDLKAAASFFGWSARLFAFLFAFSAVAYCVYLWYGTIYRPGWSDFQKQEYRKTKTIETVFNKGGFEYDVYAFQARAVESQKKLENLTDIFKLKNTSTGSSVPSASGTSNPQTSPNQISPAQPEPVSSPEVAP